MIDLTDEKLNKLIDKLIIQKKRLEHAYDWYKNNPESNERESGITGEVLKNLNLLLMTFPRGDLNKDYENLEDLITRREDEINSLEKDSEFSNNHNLETIYTDYKNNVNELKEHINYLNGKVKKDVDKEFLNETLSGERTIEKFDTGILNDYRNWGIERICLDGIQNHLPEDSKGTTCFIHFLIDDKWMDIKEAIEKYDEKTLKSGIIKKVRFADDGVGFDKKNLKYLSSQKSSEDLSVGQFGEGLKLVAMASVNFGLDMEVQSKNWVAKAKSKDVEISNYRDTEIGEKIDKKKQLYWEVTEFKDCEIKGSRTIFNNPSIEFIENVLKLPENVLELSEKKVLFTNISKNSIVDIEKGGKLYNKGIYVKDFNSFFSYDFSDSNISLNPDRNDFQKIKPKYLITGIIEDVDDIDIIKKLLENIEKNYGSHKDDKEDELPSEYKAVNKLLENIKEDNWIYAFRNWYISKMWKKAFDELYTPKENDEFEGVVLKTEFNGPEVFNDTLKKYRIITLPKEWTEYLSICGVKTDKDIIPDYIEENIQTSLTSDYSSKLWGLERIIIDGCQNHLPSDSGGKNTFIRFKTKDGNWYSYKELEKFKDSDIEKIKICDDGNGYDYKSLGLLVSTKENNSGSGKWGEGLKMISASALRNNVELELRSRNWVAKPYFSDEIINEGQVNEKKLKRLNFNVKRETKENGIFLEDDDIVDGEDGFKKENEKSSTTFINPSPELLKYFRNIKDYVLAFSDEKEFVNTEEIDVLDITKGNLFVKGLLVPGNHQLKYSYNLKNFDIETRDRNAIRNESMKIQLSKLFRNVKNSSFIKIFLSEASNYAIDKDKNEDFIEYSTFFTILPNTENADIWIESFKKFFGENACIRSASDQDYSNGMAEHMGLKTITLPDTIAKALTSTEGRDGQKIQSYEEAKGEAIRNAIPLSESELTQEDKKIIEQLLTYGKEVLPYSSSYLNTIDKINVFYYKDDYNGQKAAGYAHFGNEVNINIETIRRGLRYATDVFFHEVGHAETGARDDAPEFRDFHTDLIAGIVTNSSKLEMSIKDNGVAKDVIFSKVKDIYNALKEQMNQLLRENPELLHEIEKKKKGENR